jgi:hypothetical protein
VPPEHLGQLRPLRLELDVRHVLRERHLHLFGEDVSEVRARHADRAGDRLDARAARARRDVGERTRHRRGEAAHVRVADGERVNDPAQQLIKVRPRSFRK